MSSVRTPRQKHVGFRQHIHVAGHGRQPGEWHISPRRFLLQEVAHFAQRVLSLRHRLLHGHNDDLLAFFMMTASSAEPSLTGFCSPLRAAARFRRRSRRG
jgi:hypothetical protein